MRLGRARRTPAGRRIHQAVRTAVLLVGMVCLGGMAVYNSGGMSAGAGGWDELRAGGGGVTLRGAHDDITTQHTSRRLLEGGSLYPKDLFTLEEMKSGAVVLHIIGVLYTFIAIAIVCDDFFVPALEVLVEKYDIEAGSGGLITRLNPVVTL